MKQRLALEFPEIVKHLMRISEIRGFTPIIGWLAGSHQNQRYDNKYAQSVAHELKIKISDYTRSHCQTIVDLELRITKRYDELVKIVKMP